MVRFGSVRFDSVWFKYFVDFPLCSFICATKGEQTLNAQKITRRKKKRIKETKNEAK